MTFIEFLKAAIINVCALLMMSAKVTSSALFKITVFWNKGNDVTIPGHDVTKSLSLAEVIL